MLDYNIPLKGKILSKKELVQGVYFFQLGLEKKEVQFNPGQFGLLSLNGVGAVPVGYAGGENKKGIIELLVRSVGSVTSQTASLDSGSQIGWVGPLGNGFPMRKNQDKNIVIITGGCGIAPFRSVIKYILTNRKNYGRVQLMYGAKMPDQLYFKEEFGEWEKGIEVYPIVEEKKSFWKGEVGNVTDLLDRHLMDSKNSTVFLCGPEPMYEPTVQKLIGKGFTFESIYVSLERKMKCGIGKCQHCTCGSQYVCLNGPVFSYSDYREMIKFN